MNMSFFFFFNLLTNILDLINTVIDIKILQLVKI